MGWGGIGDGTESSYWVGAESVGAVKIAHEHHANIDTVDTVEEHVASTVDFLLLVRKRESVVKSGSSGA
jgi:hypothetical protein